MGHVLALTSILSIYELTDEMCRTDRSNRVRYFPVRPDKETLRSIDVTYIPTHITPHHTTLPGVTLLIYPFLPSFPHALGLMCCQSPLYTKHHEAMPSQFDSVQVNIRQGMVRYSAVEGLVTLCTTRNNTHQTSDSSIDFY